MNELFSVMGKRKVKNEFEDIKPKKVKKEKIEEEDDDNKLSFSLSKEELDEVADQAADFEVISENYKVVAQAQELIEARETNTVWYPIVSLMYDTFQADLTFHQVGQGKKDYVQAIFTIINVNTRFGFAQPMPYSKKKQEDEAYTGGKKGGNKYVYKSHPKRPTTLAFVKALIWLYARGKRVKRLFIDGGSEFSEFKAFGENPMGWIRKNTTWYRADSIPKWADQLDTKLSLPKNIKSDPKKDDFFGKAFFIEPIKVIVFKPKEGTKRRLAIVERFNRSVKQLYQNASIANQDYREAQWMKYANNVAWQYNRTKHTGLTRFLKKQFTKRDVKEYKLDKISPSGVTRAIEKFIILGKLKETKKVDDYFDEPKRRIQIGDKVKYKIQDNKDPNKADKYKNVFAKKYYGWSQDTYTVKRKTRSNPNPALPSRTYVLMDAKRQELERRFLPHELKVVGVVKTKKAKPERVSERVFEQRMQGSNKQIKEDHVDVNVVSTHQKQQLDNIKWKEVSRLKKEPKNEK